MDRLLFRKGRALLLCFGVCLMPSGCQMLGSGEALHWVEKGEKNYLAARDCELLGEIVGDFGDDDAYLTIILSDDNLRSGARSDLEDRAQELGANTIEIVDNREYQKMLRTKLGLFKVEITANAYRCVR